MKNLEHCLNSILENNVANNIAVKVGKNHETLMTYYLSNDGKIDEYTLFDMASITKILATTSLCLIALDKSLIHLTDNVSDFFSFETDKQDMTIFNLLTHTMGIGHKPLNQPENNIDNIAEYILGIPSDVNIGSEVLYSCPGFILLGKILEKVFGQPLDTAFLEYVCNPLKMRYTLFCPTDKTNIVNSNIDKNEAGIVNDYNCQHLGGVAGNAGVFSNIHDLTMYVNMLLSNGFPIIRENTFKKAICNYTPEMSASRGLGFLYVDQKYQQTGQLFPVGSFGHCGHTGQSIFVDPESGLYVIILSDATITTHKKYGKENYNEVKEMRATIHNAIKQYSDWT